MWVAGARRGLILCSKRAESMRLFAITVFVGISTCLGLGQDKPQITGEPDQIRLLAEHEVRTGGALKLRGHVRVITSATILYADEADYDVLTGELEARGHVHIEFKKVRPSISIQNSTPDDIPLWSPK